MITTDRSQKCPAIDSFSTFRAQEIPMTWAPHHRSHSKIKMKLKIKCCDLIWFSLSFQNLYFYFISIQNKKYHFDVFVLFRFCFMLLLLLKILCFSLFNFNFLIFCVVFLGVSFYFLYDITNVTVILLWERWATIPHPILLNRKLNSNKLKEIWKIIAVQEFQTLYQLDSAILRLRWVVLPLLTFSYKWLLGARALSKPCCFYWESPLPSFQLGAV